MSGFKPNTHMHVFRRSLDPRWMICDCGAIDTEYVYPAEVVIKPRDVLVVGMRAHPRNKYCHIYEFGAEEFLCGLPKGLTNWQVTSGTQPIHLVCALCTRLYLDLRPRPKSVR